MAFSSASELPVCTVSLPSGIRQRRSRPPNRIPSGILDRRSDLGTSDPSSEMNFSTSMYANHISEAGLVKIRTPSSQDRLGCCLCWCVGQAFLQIIIYSSIVPT